MGESKPENEANALERSEEKKPEGKPMQKSDKPAKDSDVGAESNPQGVNSLEGTVGSKENGHHKIEKKKKKKKKPRVRKKKPTQQAILYATPTAADDADPLADLLPLSERSTFLHGLIALDLPSRDIVRNMSDKNRHDYITSATSLCERVLQTLHDLLSAADLNAMGGAQPSLDEQLMADMVRLKRQPLARRYVEMTMWQRVSQFNKDCLAKVEGVAFGAGHVQSPGEGMGILRHEPDSKDVKFNSFRDKYLNDMLKTHEDDLEKIRLAENLDLEHVSFLRSCLESAANLFANVETWDEEQQLKQSSNNTRR